LGLRLQQFILDLRRCSPRRRPERRLRPWLAPETGLDPSKPSREAGMAASMTKPKPTPQRFRVGGAMLVAGLVLDVFAWRAILVACVGVGLISGGIVQIALAWLEQEPS
jgi:hypothetical protein